jgi:hypothetical protein
VARTRTTWTKGNPPPTAFKPGQSGNPSGGKPLIDDIHALARQHAPEAIQALVDALRDPERAIPAAVAILDRGYGKPPIAVYAAVNATVFPGGPDIPPREDLQAWLARRRRELAALDGPRQAPVPGESAQPQRASSTAPNGETVAPGERAPSRTAQPSAAAGGAGPSLREEKTQEEREWLRQQRRRLNIEDRD